MKQPEELIVGRIYFDIAYEDDDLRYPIVHSYEYCGLSEKRNGFHQFRCLGSDDSLWVKYEDLEFIADVGEIVASLKEWAQRNPNLAS